jgi:hypothetical protein
MLVKSGVGDDVLAENADALQSFTIEKVQTLTSKNEFFASRPYDDDS